MPLPLWQINFNALCEHIAGGGFIYFTMGEMFVEMESTENKSIGGKFP